MKFYNYARKRRQLKFLAKQLRKQLAANGGLLTKQAERLVAKMKKMLLHKNPIISRIDFRKAVGAAAILFGLGMSTPATAQNFALPETLPFGLDSISNYALPAFVDLDADGDLDLFAGQYGEVGVYSMVESNFLYFENTTTESNPVLGVPLANPFGTMIAAENEVSMPAFADLDGDGDQDLISGSNYGDFLFYENVGTDTAPMFADLVSNPFGLDSVFYLSFPELVDLDGDGDFDLLSGEAYYNPVTDENYGNFVFFENTGTATAPAFAAPVTNPFGLSSVYSINIPAAGDIDDDGDMDIITGEYYGKVVYFENTGTATAPVFAAPISNPFGIVVNPDADLSILDLADIDSDGDLDLFIFDDYGVGHFYENTVLNPVSVKEVAPAFELDVFPNPVQDELVIRTKEEIDQVEVIDLLGRTLDILQPVGNTIALGHLYSGVYTLRVMDKNGSFVVRKIQKL